MATDLEYMEKHANKSALELMDSWIEAHERGARELKRYRERFVSEVQLGNPNGPKEVLSWALNETQNTGRNLRLDLGVIYGAELGAVAHLKRQAKTP